MARTSSKIVKIIPNSEDIKVECLNGRFLVTHNSLKEQFTLWERLEDGFERVKTSDSPLTFDKTIPW